MITVVGGLKVERLSLVLDLKIINMVRWMQVSLEQLGTNFYRGS